MDKESFANYLSNYLHLMALYLNKKEAPDFKIDEQSFSFFVKLSKQHSLMALLYKALKDTKVAVNQEHLKKLEEYYLANVRKNVLFKKEREDLFAHLNNQQIDFLPLKGLVLTNYYLDPDTREYADNDILFSSKEKDIKEFFVKRDYKIESFKNEKHDVYLKKPFFNFEMHRTLFDETNDFPESVNYFADFLKKAPIKEGHEHYSTKEDFYIYFTAHTYKHFSHSGCGIRTLIDYYLYLKNNDLDFAYIDQEFKKLNILDFSHQIASLSLKVFNEEELSDNEKEMLLYIATSGTYGTLQNSVDKGVKEKGKFKYFMYRIFPPMSYYKVAYPWAYKSKVLIPIAWIARFFRILFKNPKKAKKEIELISKSNNEKNVK